uniref:Uncharacterized protein n=1 Tax=Kalanchoe fedtschenkoi TaxID=63787 RepID=A0A7N0RI80_KALFE
MILYLMQDYRMELARGSHVIFLWSAATNFTPLLGAFIADAFTRSLNDLLIALGCISSLLLRPPSCDGCKVKPASPAQLTLLYSSLALMSIGAGGIRPCSLAFGADQLDKREVSDSSNKSILESYLGWYYASSAVSVLISFTGIVYIQDHFGWKIGFGVPAFLMFLSAWFFLIASNLYVKCEASTNLLVSFAQVIVACYRKRRVPFPPLSAGGECYHHDKGKGSEFLYPTDKLRVLPMWSTGIMMTVNVAPFQLVLAESHLTRSFEIPAGSFGVFLIISLTIWIVVCDRAILPPASKLRAQPLSCQKSNMSDAFERMHSNNSEASIVPMSALWLIPQNVLQGGLAEAFNAVAQIEFYYSELPKSMSSIAAALLGLGMAMASLLASAIISTVDRINSKNGRTSWVSSDINAVQYDCLWYGPCSTEVVKSKKSKLEEEEASMLGNRHVH